MPVAYEVKHAQRVSTLTLAPLFYGWLNFFKLKFLYHLWIEVSFVHANGEQLQIAPTNTQRYNPAFDVTPGELVTAFILDKGVFKAEEIANIS